MKKTKTPARDKHRPAAKRPGDAAPTVAFSPPIRAAYLDKPAHLRTRAEREDAGRALRVGCPREAHATYTPAPERADPVQQLIDSSAGRIERLVPIRYGRMAQSPFAFYRGAAALMAADLAGTPCTGQLVQACGDAHLVNFGAFATPERRVVVDLNDFDETFPAPWEWDLKRLATSFVVASRHNGHKDEQARDAAAHCVRHYAAKLQELAAMPALRAWYDSLEFDTVVDTLPNPVFRERARAYRDKAMARDAGVEFVKLAQVKGGMPRIRDLPPLIFHLDQHNEPGFDAEVRTNLERYRQSLPPERRVLLDRYELADVAMKVVGVGSVGTTCAVAMLFAAEDDPLFLQLKEARASVLAPHVKVAPFASEGERVVFGQRLMQASSDLFLGHLVTARGTPMYVRQLRDVKIKPQVELYAPQDMRSYARITGCALARAHARSGGPAQLAGYIGGGKVLAHAIGEFAVAYAEQNARDHAALIDALRAGRLEADFVNA